MGEIFNAEEFEGNEKKSRVTRNKTSQLINQRLYIKSSCFIVLCVCVCVCVYGRVGHNEILNICSDLINFVCALQGQM